MEETEAGAFGPIYVAIAELRAEVVAGENKFAKDIVVSNHPWRVAGEEENSGQYDSAEGAFTSLAASIPDPQSRSRKE